MNDGSFGKELFVVVVVAVDVVHVVHVVHVVFVVDVVHVVVAVVAVVVVVAVVHAVDVVHTVFVVVVDHFLWQLRFSHLWFRVFKQGLKSSQKNNLAPSLLSHALLSLAAFLFLGTRELLVS